MCTAPHTHTHNTDVNKFWQTHVDAESKSVYYYNSKTHESSWEKPEGMISLMGSSSRKSFSNSSATLNRSNSNINNSINNNSNSNIINSNTIINKKIEETNVLEGGWQGERLKRSYTSLKAVVDCS